MLAFLYVYVSLDQLSRKQDQEKQVQESIFSDVSNIVVIFLEFTMVPLVNGSTAKDEPPPLADSAFVEMKTSLMISSLFERIVAVFSSCVCVFVCFSLFFDTLSPTKNGGKYVFF
jgi:hypothetical protein